MLFQQQHRLIKTCLFVCTGLMLAACGDKAAQPKAAASGAAAPAPAVSTASDKNVYRVATMEDFPPFVMRDEKGLPTGFDIDLLNAIGESQGIKFSYEMKIWSEILPGLAAGKHDIGTSITINDERKQQYGFSDAYIDARLALILKDNSHENKPVFASFAEAVKNSKTLTAQTDSAPYNIAQKIAQDNNVKLIGSESTYTVVNNVVKGNADAAYDNEVVLNYFAAKYNTDPKTKVYTVADTDRPSEAIGFAIKKDRNDGLAEKINKGLQELKANGKYEQIKNKWFSGKA